MEFLRVHFVSICALVKQCLQWRTKKWWAICYTKGVNRGAIERGCKALSCLCTKGSHTSQTKYRAVRSFHIQNAWKMEARTKSAENGARVKKPPLLSPHFPRVPNVKTPPQSNISFGSYENACYAGKALREGEPKVFLCDHKTFWLSRLRL